LAVAPVALRAPVSCATKSSTLVVIFFLLIVPPDTSHYKNHKGARQKACACKFIGHFIKNEKGVTQPPPSSECDYIQPFSL